MMQLIIIKSYGYVFMNENNPKEAVKEAVKALNSKKELVNFVIAKVKLNCKKN